MIRPFAAAAVAVLVLSAGACGSGSSSSGSPSTPAGSGSPSTPAGSQTLTVFAAASLTKTFTTLGQQFEASHPGTKVTFDFAGSADLVTQLEQGAPADVFASADTKNMTKANGDHLLAGSPVTFASNTLEIAVPPQNPAKIASFQDLTEPGVKVVVCAPAVPCGSAAQKIEAASRTTLKPVSEENAVTDVLGKVESGEADAGLVYVTDVRGAAGKVKGVTFPESAKAVNEYPIAVLAAGHQQDLARQFRDLVTGPAGRQVLSAAGFARP